MPDFNDSGGITDEVELELNVERGPDPDAAGPADFYAQDVDDHTRIVDRWGNEFEDYPDDAVVQHETYPGEYGGPVPPTPPEPEGEPE